VHNFEGIIGDRGGEFDVSGLDFSPLLAWIRGARGAKSDDTSAF
jgi:hypothetical protein